VQLRVTIARKGNIVATQIVRSSGFEVLDQKRHPAVTSAGPLPRPPEAPAEPGDSRSSSPCSTSWRNRHEATPHPPPAQQVADVSTISPAKARSLRLRVSLVLTALAAAFVLAGAALWVRDARLAIAEEITAAHRVAAQWLAVSARAPPPATRPGANPACSPTSPRSAASAPISSKPATTGGRLLYRSPPSTYKAGHDAPAWFTHWLEPGMSRRIHMQAGSTYPAACSPTPRAPSWICGTTSRAAAGRALLALAGLFMPAAGLRSTTHSSPSTP
jgi:type II secretory pathway pseudopilin PulG